METLRRSRLPYAETVAHVQNAIVAGGGTVFLVLDQAAAAAGAGLTLRPTTLIVFGNPKAGTPLMDAFPLAALDLPLELLIWERDGIVSVAFDSMAEAAGRRGVTGHDATIAAMDHTLSALANSVT